jgi:hypothetical protein
MLRDAVPIILHHHERFGGAGYPYGLRGHEIPLGARIVAIADAYDAMIQDRPYKRKISHEAAVEELRRHAGTQFDPELVEIFCDIFGTVAPVADPTAVGFGSGNGIGHGHLHPHELPHELPHEVPDERSGEAALEAPIELPVARRTRRRSERKVAANDR